MGLAKVLSVFLGFAALQASANPITVAPRAPPPTATPTLVIDQGALNPNRNFKAPPPIPNAAASASAGPFSVTIQNSETTTVSFFYVSNVGVPPPYGDLPTTAPLAPSATTVVSYPTGWAGAIIIGPTLNPNGTRFEASFNVTSSSPSVAVNNYDISYVQGFSVPMTCSCDYTTNTGCNIDLFSENTCPELSTDGSTCLNPEYDVMDGPATPFFAPCEGAAYTYPADNGADTACALNSITCCIGTTCPPNPNQPS